MGVQCCRVQCSSTGTGVSSVRLHWKGSGHRHTPWPYLSWETHCKLLAETGMGMGRRFPRGRSSLLASGAATVSPCLLTLPALPGTCTPGLLPRDADSSPKARQPHGIGTGIVTAWQSAPTSPVQGCFLLTPS